MSISLHINPLLTPKFGWSRENPPVPERYLLPISLDSDYIEQVGDSYQPTEKLVERIIHEVFDENSDLKAPKFVMLTGLHKRLRMNGEEVYKFQDNIVKAISKIRGYVPAAEEKILVGQKNSGLISDKFSHYDNLSFQDTTPLLSLAYGPFKNIELNQGVPRISDFNQWIKDNEDEHILNLLDWGLSSLPHLFSVALRFSYSIINQSKKAQAEVVRDYSIELNKGDFKNDIPIVIINNDYNKQGVTHGASEISLGTDQERPVNRITADYK